MENCSSNIIKAVPSKGGIALARPRKAKLRVRGDKEIAQRLTQIRQARGVSQSELAEKLGVYQNEISNYERGVFGLRAPVLRGVCKVLRVSADELLGLKPPKSNGRSELPRRISKRMQKIAELPKRDQQAVFRFIDSAHNSGNGRRVA